MAKISRNNPIRRVYSEMPLNMIILGIIYIPEDINCPPKITIILLSSKITIDDTCKSNFGSDSLPSVIWENDFYIYIKKKQNKA